VSFVKTISRETYSRRIEKVLAYLTDHLEQDLDLHRLAEEAFLSPFHFHRVYVAMVGETVVETIRRRRLHAAALKLVASNLSIAKIALASGYGSSQAFTRAFREAYGVTPVKYRLHSEWSLAILQSLKLNRQEHPMYALKDVAISHLPAVPVLALRHVGDYQTIGSCFEKLMIWAAGRGLMDQAVRSYAVYYDDPISKPKHELVSDACLALPSSVDIAAVAQGDVKVLTLAASRSASFVFEGPYSELDKPYRWLYDTWLPQSGEEVGLNPPYEEYLNDARTTPPAKLLTRICIPLND
jgi:AraC family transcriptional regulator